jgi:hypothetical protein
MPLMIVPIAAEPLDEFASDPVLSVACVLLIVVSIAWIIVARSISRNLRRNDRLSQQSGQRAPRDVWKTPPP